MTPEAAAPAPTAPRFAAGDRVRVKDDWPERRGPCHIRTPHYLRGRSGVVERPLGAFPNPEDLAFARPNVTRGDIEHGGLARAVWPDQSGDLAIW